MSYIARRDDDVVMSTLNDFYILTSLGQVFSIRSHRTGKLREFSALHTQEKSAQVTYGSSTMRESLLMLGRLYVEITLPMIDCS